MSMQSRVVPVQNLGLSVTTTKCGFKENHGKLYIVGKLIINNYWMKLSIIS